MTDRPTCRLCGFDCYVQIEGPPSRNDICCKCKEEIRNEVVHHYLESGILTFARLPDGCGAACDGLAPMPVPGK